MFNKKLKEEVETQKEILSHFKSCEECGAIHDKKYMHKVMVEDLGGFSVSGSHIVSKKYYCQKHAPKYDSIVNSPFSFKYYKTNQEVDENGKDIK